MEVMLADVDAAGIRMGSSAPPIEVRMSLRPGDFAEVLAMAGDTIEAVPVRISDVAEPGRYLGELVDGSMIELGAEHVSDAAYAEHINPSMGGIFDWFLKKREGPSMFQAFGQQPPGLPAPQQPPGLPAPAPSMLPAVPQPPEAKKGLLTRFFSAIIPRPGGPSIFESFAPPRGPSGPPIVRPETVPAPVEARPSMFAPFTPKEGTVKEYKPQIFEFAERTETPTLLTPYVEQAKELFKTVEPSPPPKPYEERQAEQAALWTGVFEAPGEERPLTEMFTPFRPSPTQPEAATPEIPIPEAVRVRKLKQLPMPQRSTVVPSVEDLARAFLAYFEPIDDMWQTIREAKQGSYWQEQVRDTGVGKEQFETLGVCGGRPNALEEFASYFHIPWDEMRNRAGTTIKNYHGQEYEVWTDTSKIIEDIVFPTIENLQEAFRLIQPPDLSGMFTLEWSNDQCQLILIYSEGTYREEAWRPEPPAPEHGGAAIYEIPESERRQPPAPGKKRKKRKGR